MSSQSPHESRIIRVVRSGSAIVVALSLIWGFGSTIYLVWRGIPDGDIRGFVVPAVVGLLAACACLLSAAVWARGRLVALMATTVILAVALAGAWLTFLWMILPLDIAAMLLLWKLLGSGTLVLMAMVVTGQLLTPRTEFALTLARWSALIVTDTFLAAMILLMWTRWWWMYEEIIGIGSFVWGTGALMSISAVSAAIRARKRRAKEREALSHRPQLRLTCPRCSEEQVLMAGSRRCAACRQRLLIAIEEPRCECGYLLYQLAGDTCPECGRSIDARLHWPASQSPAESTSA